MKSNNNNKSSNITSNIVYDAKTRQGTRMRAYQAVRAKNAHGKRPLEKKKDDRGSSSKKRKH